MVLGITQLADIWFKPFIALHYVDQTYYSGNNGYVVGWVAGYDFNLVNQKFSITNWHEMEFDRNKRYGNGGKMALMELSLFGGTPRLPLLQAFNTAMLIKS